jgi:alkanesulfonate monooxygenase SsuD/methylene tetrahydromethanopterin reductase-like flavin-dependent oxidoreductase (luciferase family)
MIKYGLNVPNFGSYSDTSLLMNLAMEAEKAHWDGIFLWDHMYLSTKLEKDNQLGVPFVDPLVGLTAIAIKTKKINMGTYVTPLPRRRPWKLAREIVSLDRLSKGRVILGIGLGAPEFEFEAFGEEKSIRIRANKCDEGLDILKGLFSGAKFDYSGKHYDIKEVVFKPKPFNDTIPIWIAGRWPNKKGFQRASNYNGVCPISANSEKISPYDVKEIIQYIRKFRNNLNNFDIVISGKTPKNFEKSKLLFTQFIDAGITWWLEDINDWRGSPKEMREYISRGPPKYNNQKN